MFIELLITSSAVQRDLMDAYEASDRMREIGLFMLVQNTAATQFFEQITPPQNCLQLHAACLKYQRLGIEVLEAELDGVAPAAAQLVQQYEDAARELAAQIEKVKSIDPAASRA